MTVLDGTDTLNLIRNESVLQELDEFELRWRKAGLPLSPKRLPLRGEAAAP